MPPHKTYTQQINGHSFHIRSWGDETLPKLLMLHGFPEFGGAWETLAGQLCHAFHCIAPDQRGYGQSWAPPDIANYKTSDLVSDMAALMGDGPYMVLGHDWGAAVAYGLAFTHPGQVSRLIILNGVHPVPFQRALANDPAQAAASQYIHALRKAGSEDRLSADRFAKLLSLFSANMDLSWMDSDRSETYIHEWSRSGRMRGMINWYRASPLVVPEPGKPIEPLPEFRTDLLQVRCPHLLVWGQDDQALLPVSTDGLEDFAPDLTRVSIPGADHWLHHQKPQEVASAILDWVSPPS